MSSKTDASSSFTPNVQLHQNIQFTKAGLAAQKGQISILRQMQHSGYNLATQNSNGDTIAHIAARYGQIKVLSFLNDNNIDLFVKNNKQETSVDIAKHYNQVHALALLLELRRNCVTPQHGERKKSSKTTHFFQPQKLGRNG